MKIIYALTVVLTLSFNSSAQTASWGHYLEGGENQALKVATDPNGNVFVLGKTYGTDVDFDPGFPVVLAGADTLLMARYYVAKYSATGAFQWVKSLYRVETVYDYPFFIDTDDQGNVYIAGTFRGSTDFDPGVNEFIWTTPGGSSNFDPFVQKLDANGDFVLAKRLSGPGAAIMRDFVVKGNNIYFACNYGGFHAWDGVTESGNGYNNAVVQWSTSGANIVNRFHSATNSNPVGLAIDDDYNIYVTGRFYGSFSGALNGISASGRDIYVMKYSASALINADWVRGMGGPSDDQPKFIVVDRNGKTTIGLEHTFAAGTIDVDPGVGVVSYSGTQAMSGGAKTILVQLDENGDYVWSNELVNETGGAYLKSLFVDTNNNIYTSGSITALGSVDFDFSANTAILNGSSSFPYNQVTWIQKIDANGLYQWVHSISGGTLFGGQNSDLYLCGRMNQDNPNTGQPGPSQFGTIANPFELYPSNSINNISFLIKYVQCSVDNSTTLAGTTITASQAASTYQWIDCATNSPISGATAQTFTPTVTGNYAVIVSDGTCSDTSICTAVTVSGGNVGMAESIFANTQIFPNPTNDFVTISNVPFGTTINITDASGRLTYSMKSELNSSTIDLSNNEAGMYFITLKDLAGNSSTTKLVLRK